MTSSLRQASFLGIISESTAMQRVFSLVNKVSKTNSTVLIFGESGTGKELVARAIHKLSARSGKLVPVNCGAIPEEILESELFGHEKGAFTGAISSKIGRFQMADGGTIFLDEIGEMSPKLQVKLLRVLQERIVEPVGSTRSTEVNVRVIAATNKDLREEVRAGRFREDLYYRLQVVPIDLPALRARGNDVELLCNYFLERTASQTGMQPIKISAETFDLMRAYSWPGNIRELENLMERLAILAEGEILRPYDLPDYIQNGQGIASRASTAVVEVGEAIPEDGIDFNELVNGYENKLILMALEKTGGNKKAAAKLLRLNRTTLVEKIKKKGLEGKIEVLSDNEDEVFSDFSGDASFATVEL